MVWPNFLNHFSFSNKNLRKTNQYFQPNFILITISIVVDTGLHEKFNIIGGEYLKTTSVINIMPTYLKEIFNITEAKLA